MSGHVQEDYPLVGGYGENRSKWFYVGAIVFVCWNILLFSLAVAAIAKVNNIKDPEQPEPYVFSQTVSAAVNSTIPALNVVSLLPNGSVRSGAGTTIYSKTSPPPPFGVGAQNLRVARFVEQGAEDHVIVAFANNTATYLVLGTLSLDKQSVSGWYTPVKMEFSGFSDLITLPNNHFVIAAEKAIYAGTATLKPGAMSISALGSVNYPEPVYRDVKLTALGVSTFVLSYDTGFINVNEYITFGAVVGSVIWDMANKIPNVTFATDPLTWHGTFPIHGLFALSDTTFVVAYSSAINDSSRQLACHHVRYTSGNRNLTSGTAAVFEGVVPEYYIDAVGLDGSSGVIVFVDRNKDYALRAVVIHRSTFQIDGLHFGDVMTIEDGVADNFYTTKFNESAVTFIDSAKVSANKAVVAWADYSNSGKLTTAILTLDQAANLHSSPLYVIGQELSIAQLDTYTVSVAGLSIDAYGQIGALVIDRKFATDAANSGNVALIEVAPKAFGVAVQSAFTGQTAKIVVNGLVDLPRSFPNDLKPGYLYYGLTDGSIEAGPLAGTVDKSAPYVTLSDGTIVTVDSAVAVAVSKRQLYVLPSFN